MRFLTFLFLLAACHDSKPTPPPTDTVATLKAKYPAVFAEAQAMGTPKRGDIIVKEPGVKGEWPEFSLNAEGMFVSPNYAGTYPPMTAAAFTTYVEGVASKLAK